MPRETVIDNEYCTMWYYPEEKIVAHQIKKFIFGEAFQKFLLTGTDLMGKHRAQKWLSDDRYSPVLRKQDIDWGAVNWFPQTKKNGWKWWAIVQPVKAIGAMNMEELIEMYGKQGIIAKVFTDVDEAFKWLKAQKD